MKVISLADWPKYPDLERAFYEKTAYENIISYMSNNGIKDTMGYFDEYKQVVKSYYDLCRALEKEILFPTMGEMSFTWEVDFIEREVKVRETST